jgi:heme-degrading monooxygenase HmoA
MDLHQTVKEIYTFGVWTVKPGMEKDFINEWTQFANWTSKNIDGADKAYLLQDEKNPSRFISYGPWDKTSTIDRWRQSEEFRAFVTKTKALCDNFEPNTLKLVSASE